MKFTQIAVGPESNHGHVLYALDRDGKLWAFRPEYTSKSGWREIATPPEPENRFFPSSSPTVGRP